MRKYLLVCSISILLVFQASVSLAGQLSFSLEQYREKVRLALDSSTDESIRTYLQACLSAADNLNGLEADDFRVSEGFGKFVRKRLDAEGELPLSHIKDANIMAEQTAYNSHLYPYRKAEYISFVALQDQLLERKYFRTETAKNSNFLEAYANSNLPLTKADINAGTDTPNLGVSPWEAIFRLEPAVVFVDGTHLAILGTAGLSFTFFPEIDRSKVPIRFQESFKSKQIKKSGGRIGIGAGQIDDKTRLLMGAGMQISAIAFWGLYEPDRETTMLGISASDLSKMKKFIGWFD